MAYYAFDAVFYRTNLKKVFLKHETKVTFNATKLAHYCELKKPTAYLNTTIEPTGDLIVFMIDG